MGIREGAQNMLQLFGQLMVEKFMCDEFLDVVVYERNKMWERKWSSALSDPNSIAMLTCGAGHLYGPKGMLAYLERTGWTVRNCASPDADGKVNFVWSSEETTRKARNLMKE